ncbi:hypothetical protein V4V36_09625 [Paenibacillus lautus]|jgi:hypothetical protein|uniref:hypothetical protein n=1 Tax=Bacillales TaxID=1385 RepID=UPI0001788B38|nr:MULTISPECIES: hypothetical protein [Paenibacillus]MBY0164386.1 hypothetical protein [Cytobacillus firmus]ACX62853.1 hypothetical protein GYMC10_0550 [Paenibacillus sp. Y412MC10]EGG36202.1 hypothetical protein HMPREF9412_3707 [Paenibacillus sp. HGF5]ETT59845.1 hypothetical protein C172_23463 [Paenibacillus sp. FSL H8-457]MBU5347634.1 hypothetical protein [Paenibacillus lautus]
MKTTSRRCSLQMDDYLDLLNLAIQLGDVKWQKEITRKMEMTLSTLETAAQ